MLACGQAQFDYKKEFCQRTISTANSTNLGEFAVASATGAIAKGSYPTTLDGITNPESPYNSTNMVAGVTSVVLPLCGSYPAVTDAQVLDAHSGHVYNANQYCGRTLVVKIGTGTSRYSASDGSQLNGKPVAGGALDNDPNSPNSPAWKVLAKGQCAIDLVSAEKGNPPIKINGFNFTTSGVGFDKDKITRDCSWMEAITTAANPIYTYCPETADVVALDDVKCVPRTATTGGCIYHSTIDKTCLVQESATSLYGTHPTNGGSPDSAKITHIIIPSSTPGAADVVTAYGSATATTKATAPSTWKYTVSKVNGTGIKGTKVGSRFGLGLLPDGALDDGGNLWSKACVTLTRPVYIAVNDPYLSNKGFKEDPLTGLPSGVGGLTKDNILVQGPLCAGDIKTPAVGTTPAVLQEAVAFENAVACLNGTLSLDFKINGQSIGYDGTSWDKPLFCVQTGASGYGLTATCKITAPTITDNESCSTIDGFKSEASGANPMSGFGTTLTPSWSTTANACLISIAAGAIPTHGADAQAVCNNIIGATRAQTDPLGGTGVVTAVWNTSTVLGTDHINNNGGCVITSTETEIVSGATTPSNVLTPTRCADIKELTYGLNANKVPGTISGTWVSGVSVTSCSVPSLNTTNCTTGECSVSTLNATTCTIGECSVSTLNATNCTIGECSVSTLNATNCTIGECVGDASGKLTSTTCTIGLCDGGDALGTENETACASTTGTWIQPGSSWTAPGTWTAPGSLNTTTSSVCKVSSSTPGAVAANNCAWINRAAASEPNKFPIPNAITNWGAN
jgi:hypothetical protein